MFPTNQLTLEQREFEWQGSVLKLRISGFVRFKLMLFEGQLYLLSLSESVNE